jgi:hypothetical protein
VNAACSARVSLAGFSLAGSYLTAFSLAAFSLTASYLTAFSLAAFQLAGP